MHELSICQSILDVTSRYAAGRRVSVVHVRVGQLRQIVPDTLVYCWDLVSEGTAMSGARMDVSQVPARIRCRACDHEAPLGDLPVFACAECGGVNVEVTAGEEFLITSLELSEEVST